MSVLSRFIAFFSLVSFFACQSDTSHELIREDADSFVFPTEELKVSDEVVQYWQEALDSHFNRLHKLSNFNGNVLIARKGNIIYSGSFGLQNLETGDSLNIHSLFQIASVSKTFTAMAIMLLSEEGHLSLNQNLNDFFEEFPYSGVTIEDLLTHRSGLPNYLYATEKQWDGQDLKTNYDLLEFLIQEKPSVQGHPNRFFAYNNTNYALLALIIEQVSGKSFAEFMQERIFDPLQMHDTYIFSAENRKLPLKNLTVGYHHRTEKDKFVPADGIVGDKNIYTTTEDLLKWERANSHPYLFSQSILDSVSVGRSHEKPGRKNYGYGWRIWESQDNGKIVYHHGWWHGYTATFSRNPKDETVVIILSNIFNRVTYQIQPVWEILYNGQMVDFEGE